MAGVRAGFCVIYLPRIWVIAVENVRAWAVDHNTLGSSASASAPGSATEPRIREHSASLPSPGSSADGLMDGFRE